MLKVSRGLFLIAVLTTVGVGHAHALPSPTETKSQESIAPAPKPGTGEKPGLLPRGRCLFPSGRALGLIISDQAKKVYTQAGYKEVVVTARVVVKRAVPTQLSISNVRGIADISPQTGSPANLIVKGSGAGTPIEIGCNAEADLITTVSLLDKDGKRVRGRTANKVVVQGVFY